MMFLYVLSSNKLTIEFNLVLDRKLTHILRKSPHNIYKKNNNKTALYMAIAPEVAYGKEIHGFNLKPKY